MSARDDRNRLRGYLIDGARGVLLMLAGGSDLGLFEVNEAADVITKAAHAEANIIFGAVIDDSLGDEVKVTVIAAGFSDAPQAQQPSGVLRPMERGTRSAEPAESVGAKSHAPAASPLLDDDEDEDALFRSPAGDDFGDDGDDDLDIPSFLKR